jgi:hypothetical protein
MLSCNTVKSLLKTSSRRVAADANGNSAEFYILQNGFHTDPTRALSQLHTLLLEGDLRQLWQQTKQRLKAQLQDAYTAYQPQAATSKPSSKIAAAELQRLYGTDGVFRVMSDSVVTSSLCCLHRQCPAMSGRVRQCPRTSPLHPLSSTKRSTKRSTNA